VGNYSWLDRLWIIHVITVQYGAKGRSSDCDEEVVQIFKGTHARKKVFDTRKTDVTHTTFVNPTIWKEVYGNVKEDIPPDMPIAKMKPSNTKIHFHPSYATYFQKDQILRSLDSGECQNGNQNDRDSQDWCHNGHL